MAPSEFSFSFSMAEDGDDGCLVTLFEEVALLLVNAYHKVFLKLSVTPIINMYKRRGKKGNSHDSQREWKSRNGIVGTCKSEPYQKNVLLEVSHLVAEPLQTGGYYPPNGSAKDGREGRRDRKGNSWSKRDDDRNEKKTMERLAEEMRENNSYKKKEESGTSDGSIMKLKGKMEEMDNPRYTEQSTSLRSTTYRSREGEGSSAPLPYVAESVLRDAFLTGLEPALQAEVISRHPQTLEECMKEAQLVNDRNLALKLARAELGILEPKGGESSTTKAQLENEKGMSRKNEF
ncbi:retrotransposon protein [Cucumis melo var. makuwa]|uniref:Retrotransposon protein n=1 Tax=Cucumis melo var. makuwa TaxID=1194695 RepID=A0A5D3C4D8_CUCMM|nr:retrotransposon protein [Cucumis melo var. makuwa]TYK05226.1 retrotransposon protein [Cucumis melo var. makuwa]